MLKEVRGRQHPLEVKRNPAHVEIQELVAWVIPVLDFWGNHLADRAAVAAAERTLGATAGVKEAADWEANTCKVAMRLAAVEVTLRPEPERLN